MAERTDPVVKELISIYYPLKGKKFEATYRVSNHPMRQNNNVRDVLSIDESEPAFRKIVQEVDANVTELENRLCDHIWTGITGPHRRSFNEYWLWCEPKFADFLEEGKAYNFKVKNFSVFEGGEYYSYIYGVSLRAKLAPN